MIQWHILQLCGHRHLSIANLLTKSLHNLSPIQQKEREEYVFGLDGIHWRNLDEDVSFESFEYEDAEPSKMQRFFLTHKEINISEFAKLIGINPSLLRSYINGFKKPSKEREALILSYIRKIGQEYISAYF